MTSGQQQGVQQRAAVRLTQKTVEKPWGRYDLPAIFPNPDGKKIGEIWFDGPEGRHPPLLVKYIFTSEKLSVQVHPNDAEAKDRGLTGGKSECWYVLDAEPDARLGIGMTQELDGEALRAAAMDGSIEALMDWKPVRPGSFYYIPAGTVHAIGAGVTLVEVQQNNDVTYRLFDYGRPRELHLDEGVSVSKAKPFPEGDRVLALGTEDRVVDGSYAPFTMDMVSWSAGAQPSLPSNKPCWFVPITGAGQINGQDWSANECWLIEDDVELTVSKDTAGFIAFK
ncbi:MAG: class I mannose-6-phosphate isomerase [Sphingobium sp.]|uniref:class I mannose-6-phosphate isomerase n=1 Tax=Sphingobium sp. TaxID=1912891 RepID=UPI0029B9C0AB|nr:class I mannose-6-phosphate isomerase [Sphingobium sp.]MDX3910970.1 class I mannose-6-phosphate isomerase [Sphingobium sp.]